MTTIIQKCKCENKGQDKLHGKGNRVMNRLQPVPGRKDRYRCTVCGAVEEIKV